MRTVTMIDIFEYALSEHIPVSQAATILRAPADLRKEAATFRMQCSFQGGEYDGDYFSSVARGLHRLKASN